MDSYYGKGKHGYMHYRGGAFSEYIYELITKNTQCNFRSYDTAFELGAGMGRFSYALAKNFPNVYLIEPSQDYAFYLIKIFEKRNNVRVFPCSAGDFFKKKMVAGKSVCFSFHLLHHLNLNERREVFNFIRETGSDAIFVEPNPRNPLITLQIVLHQDMKVKDEIQYSKLTKDILIKELNSCGITGINYFKLCLFPPLVTIFVLHTYLKSFLPFFEKLNKTFAFFGSYHAFYCQSNTYEG